MSEFKFGYESPTRKIDIQIPVCLLGKPDPDILPNIANMVGITNGTNVEEPEQNEGKRFGNIFKKKPGNKVEKASDGKTDGLTVATGVMLLSSMILAALKD